MSETGTSHSIFNGIRVRIGFLIVGTLAIIVLYCLAWAYPTFPGDEATLIRLQSFRREWLDAMAVIFDNLGSLWTVLPSVVVLTVFLFLTRRYADVGLFMGGLVFVGMGKVLKLLVERPRPDYQIIEPFASGFSFPSGHSLFAVILGGVLVYWVDQWVGPKLPRRVIQILLVLVVIGMGASRVYLGVHWPSDVIGSYLLGILALTGLFWLREAWPVIRNSLG